jgi:NitT/TauT family transport system ATP-binding protein
VSYIEVVNVSKWYGDAQSGPVILDSISLDIQQGEFVSLVGPSGCGKSTLLQIIAGLKPPSAGAVRLSDRTITAPPFEMIYVFQQYTRSIFPWKTVSENVAFGLERRRQVQKQEIARRCAALVSAVGLTGFESYYPWQLSGGMQQRVALARALACEPNVLLMDEPFGSVDALTRTELQDLILELWQQLRLTILFVTHDIDEAIYLSDRVEVMSRAPAHLIENVVVELARPRQQVQTRESSAYLEYRRVLFDRVFAQQRQVTAAARGAP